MINVISIYHKLHIKINMKKNNSKYFKVNIAQLENLKNTTNIYSLKKMPAYKSDKYNHNFMKNRSNWANTYEWCYEP